MLEHFVELRKYIEHSHDGLSERLEKVEAGQQRLEAGFTVLDGGLSLTRGDLARLARNVDTGLDRLARKIDALAPARRAAPRRRKP